MIKFKAGGQLVQQKSELPAPREGDVFLDFETSSGDPKLKSIDPWRNCRACGLAVAWKDGDAYYVPRYLIDETWLKDVFERADRWVNHNIKYDAHVLMNDFDFDFPKVELVDTITCAKLIDSDRRFKGGYGLDVLSRDWLGYEIGDFEQAMFPYLAGAKNQDYGRVPHDIIGEYACHDVLAVRQLAEFIDDNMPEEMGLLYRDEIALTKALFAMERRGMVIDETSLKLARVKSLNRMMQIAETLQDRLGYVMNPVSTDDCFDLLCNRFGLPVLKLTKNENPSFSHDTLAEYLYYEGAPKDLLELLLEFRYHSTLDGLFWQSWLELNTGGILHPDYNQSVRSGRMSCKRPNAQQLSKDAKREIRPRPGYTFVSRDYAQIEYRLIVHYIKDERSIEAYARDPDTDFHMWVASLCNVERSPAKTLNFGMAYGAGKDKVLRMLISQMSNASSHQAAQIYSTYHKQLPTLKSTGRSAARVARDRGYVRNAHGRRLHLPKDRAWVAFNRLVQSEAADIAKERALHVSPVYNEWLRERDVHLVAIVHDEFLFEVPTEIVDEVEPVVKSLLEQSRVSYRVPLRTSGGRSETTWADA